MTFGECVLGLALLWFFFRFLTVVSLTAQDKQYQCQDSNDTRNADLKSAVVRQKTQTMME
jgi:hypothetical protein